MNYAAIDPKTDQVARFFPYDRPGLESAYRIARRHGYEVWETFDGEPQYLIHSAKARG